VCSCAVKPDSMGLSSRIHVKFVASMPEIGLRFAPFPVGGMTGRFPASVRTSGTYDGASNTVERLA
jgi:hypothetical protein